MSSPPDRKILDLDPATSLDPEAEFVLAAAGQNNRMKATVLAAELLDQVVDGLPPGVDTFHTRVGHVVLQSSDLNGLDGSGLSGIGTGTGGVINTGTTTIGADSDSDGVGVVALQTRGTTREQIANDGAHEFLGQVAPALSASGQGRLYFDSSVKRLMLSQNGGAYSVIGEPAGVFNVRSYGATGDGVTNDTAALVAAKNALEAAGGGIFYLPPGDYLVTGSGSEILLFTKPVWIVGAGWQSRFKIATASSSSTPLIRIFPAAGVSLGGPGVVNPIPYASLGVVLKDFAVIPQTAGSGGSAIFLDGTNTNDGGLFRNLKVDHIYVGQLAAASWGIVATNGANPNGVPGPATAIRNCEFRRGLSFPACGDTVEICNNRFAGPGAAAELVVVAGASSLKFAHNNIISAGGVQIGGNLAGGEISSNIMELSAAASQGGQLEGVDSFGHNNAVLDITGAGVIHNVRIANNVISNLSGTTELDGIRLHNTSAAQVSNNYIYVRGTRKNVLVTTVGSGASIGDNSYVGPSKKADNFYWDLTNRAIIPLSTAAIDAGSGFINFTQNLYYDGTNWRVYGAGASSVIAQGGGATSIYGQNSLAANDVVTLVELLRVLLTGSVAIKTAGEGIILKSPNGALCKKLTIDNAGAIVLTTVTCP